MHLLRKNLFGFFNHKLFKKFERKDVKYKEDLKHLEQKTSTARFFVPKLARTALPGFRVLGQNMMKK